MFTKTHTKKGQNNHAVASFIKPDVVFGRLAVIGRGVEWVGGAEDYGMKSMYDDWEREDRLRREERARVAYIEELNGTLKSISFLCGTSNVSLADLDVYFALREKFSDDDLVSTVGANANFERWFDQVQHVATDYSCDDAPSMIQKFTKKQNGPVFFLRQRTEIFGDFRRDCKSGRRNFFS